MAKSIQKINWLAVLFLAAAALVLLVLIAPALPASVTSLPVVGDVVAFLLAVKAYVEANYILLGILLAIALGFWAYMKRGKR